MIDKRLRLKSFYGYTDDYIRKQLPGNKGWVEFFWALENEARLFGSNFNRQGAGYILQEAKRLFNE
jgi:hypothetical protein